MTVLKHIAAMTPGNSKLLIFEWALPSRMVPWYPSLLDVNMMVVLNGMEWMKEQLTNLLRQAGLKFVKFWSAGPESEGLFDLSIRRPFSDDSCSYLCQCLPQYSSIKIRTRNYTQI